MLTTCPECDLPVSDKAAVCPHCGYPLKSNKTIKRRNPAKRKRLPNGFGQITEIKGRNLRNPFRVMVTVGKTTEGKPICKLLKPRAYFPTYNEAYAALVEYWKNPYDLDNALTVKELYEKWTRESLKNASAAYHRTISSAWAYCSGVYDLSVRELKAKHIKACMEQGYRIEQTGKHKGEKKYPTAGIKTRIKSLFNNMLDYAVEYELISSNPARSFEVSGDIVKETKENKRSHIPFTNEELNILWANVNSVRFTDWVLIQCYMGWRPQELATLRLDEVYLDGRYMKAGMKTDAGKQRIVPIHSKVYPLVKKNYDLAKTLNSEYLFNDKGQTHAGSLKLTYDKYAKRFDKVVAALNLNPKHRPHDPRMTFITMGKRAGMDEYALKEMVGHSIQDITESVYTVRDLEWLRSDLEKIK